jgi:uncharacterized protein (DUF924 family)
MTPEEVLEYWFADGLTAGWPSRPMGDLWFGGGEAVDNAIRTRFGPLVEEAMHGGLTHWEAPLLHRLALVILLDQFTRNVYRGQARAFDGDSRARALAIRTLSQGEDRQLPLVGRVFMAMPLMHTEDPASQADCVRHFENLVASADTPHVSNCRRTSNPPANTRQSWPPTGASRTATRCWAGPIPPRRRPTCKKAGASANRPPGISGCSGRCGRSRGRDGHPSGPGGRRGAHASRAGGRAGPRQTARSNTFAGHHHDRVPVADHRARVHHHGWLVQVHRLWRHIDRTGMHHLGRIGDTHLDARAANPDRPDHIACLGRTRGTPQHDNCTRGDGQGLDVATELHDGLLL